MSRHSPKSDFDKLKDEWYQKLQDSGFEDIESDEENLKKWSSDVFGPKKALIQNGGWQAKAEYYQMASNFLIDYKFRTKIRKQIWTQHSEGIGVRAIADELNKSGHRTNRTYVAKIIAEYRIKMFDMYMIDHKEYHE